ncbi:MAG: phosphatase PAP2 family protein [Chitinophagaceae bacterium]
MKKKVKTLLQLIPLEILVTSSLFLLSLFTFSFIVHEAVLEQEPVFDRKAILFFSTHASPLFIEAMKNVTVLGSSLFLLPAYTAVITWLLFKKKAQLAIDIAVIAVSSTAIMFALKAYFHRQRPELPIIKGISGYSFPSGHSLSSFIFCSIMIYLVWQTGLSLTRKYLLMLFFLLLAFTIGLSRVVLNVHYATDVIGGFCLGIIWAILSFAIMKKIRKKTVVGNPNGGS